MEIETRFNNMLASRDLQESIERRVEQGLGMFRDRIDTVLVQLTAVNEPRDGKDKSCKVQVFLSAGSRVLVEIMDCSNSFRLPWMN